MALSGKTISDGSVWTANSDLTAKQYCAVKIAGDGVVDLASTGGEAIAGILENNPKAGQPATVTFLGFPLAQAGAGGWTAGQELMTEAGTGKLVALSGMGTVVAVGIKAVGQGEIGVVRLVPSTG